jgi:hypothetical protein
MNYYPLDDPIFRNWLEQCPCAWDIEYVEDWGRFAFFFCPPHQKAEDFLESLCVI